MAKRGILYMVWGDSIEPMLERSLASVRKIHPELPIEVQRLPASSSLLDKSRMATLTPFEETLYLDADTVVLDRLDFGFDRATQFGLACCICESPYARRYKKIPFPHDAVEYNTGVLFFTRAALPLFETWNQYVKALDSSILFIDNKEVIEMPVNDQGAFAKAVSDMGMNPYILPMNWNFRPVWHRSFFGPIKVWHGPLPVAKGLSEWITEQAKPEAIVQSAEYRP